MRLKTSLVRKRENRKKIKLLQQYLKVQLESKEMYESYLEFRSKIMSIQNVVISDMPKACSSSGDKLSGQMAKLQEYEAQISNRLVNLVELRKYITDTIEQLEDANQRMVLMLRYLDGMTWESVAVKMNYERAQVHRLHSQALDNIKIMPTHH